MFNKFGKLKVLCLILAIIMIGMVFVGCNQVATETKFDKTLVVGTNPEFPPFEYINEKGEADGFDIALMKEIGKEIKVNIKIENMEFKSLISAIETGKIDAIIAALTVDEDRKKSVDFTNSYYSAVQNIILRKDDNSIKSIDDLKGKKIGVQEGTTGDFIATDDVEKAEVSRYKKGIDAVLDLQNKKIDAVLIDKNPANEFQKINKDKIYVIESGCEPEQYGIAVKKGNEDIVKAINEAIDKFKTNGTYEKLKKEYIDK